MSVRESFVDRFGVDQAEAIEAACEMHMTHDTSIHGNDNRGSDPFKYAFLACIGYQCVDVYASYHGISADAEALKAWAIECGDLGSHDGDVPDYLALFVGKFNDWIVTPETEDAES